MHQAIDVSRVNITSSKSEIFVLKWKASKKLVNKTCTCHLTWNSWLDVFSHF